MNEFTDERRKERVLLSRRRRRDFHPPIHTMMPMHVCINIYIYIFYCDIHNVYKDASRNCLVKYFTVRSRPTAYPQCTNHWSESNSMGIFYIDACTSGEKWWWSKWRSKKYGSSYTTFRPLFFIIIIIIIIIIILSAQTRRSSIDFFLSFFFNRCNTFSFFRTSLLSCPMKINIRKMR